MMSKNNSITTDKDLKDTVTTMENIENLSEQEMEDFLSDKEHATDVRFLLECGYAKLKHDSSLPDIEKLWQRFEQDNIQLPRKKRQLRNWKLITTTIGIAACLTLLFILYPFSLGTEDTALMAFTADNNPQQIIMTNGNSEQFIVLDSVPAHETDFKTRETADFTQANHSDNSIRTISTPRGKDYKVILSDGTTVILNAASKLTFPSHFSGKEREVTLIGEAYFKVAKDSEHPFVVHTNRIKTRVLGTEFNLKAYPSSEPHVTLIEGSVAVNSNYGDKEIILQPGEDATLDNNQEFEITTIDTDYYTQWKDGYFYFDNVPLIEVMKELGRWYNVNIEIQSNSLMSYRLHFIAERNASIDNVVEHLNEFSYLSVTKKENKITISKKNVHSR